MYARHVVTYNNKCDTNNLIEKIVTKMIGRKLDLYSIFRKPVRAKHNTSIVSATQINQFNETEGDELHNEIQRSRKRSWYITLGGWEEDQEQWSYQQML